MSLVKLMNDVGLVPPMEEETKRSIVVNKLQKIVMEWAMRVSSNKPQLSSSYTADASATIMTYGSYGLGVHSSESDIDALCVGPSIATMEDFFIVLGNIIACTPQVSDLHYSKGAKGHIMRFIFDGILIDLSYAKLNISSIPENVTLDDQRILINTDETSMRSFSRVFVNNNILQLVPNLESYRSLLRFVKYWAKVRGIYGNFIGFLGGKHLAVLTAFICQKYPEDPLCALIFAFFETFAFWHWPKLVSLDGTELPTESLSTQSSLMRIQLSHEDYMHCQNDITRSAFYRIREEFLLGHYLLTRDAPRPNFDWKILFRQFLPANNYIRLMKICLSSADQDDLQDWVGFVKSRIHYLLVKLEESQFFCDPNPTQYVDSDYPEPNIVFYWGLLPDENLHSIDYGSMIEDFAMNVLSGYERPMGKMELLVVKRYDICKKNITAASKIIKTRWRVDNSSGLY